MANEFTIEDARGRLWVAHSVEQRVLWVTIDARTPIRVDATPTLALPGEEWPVSVRINDEPSDAHDFTTPATKESYLACMTSLLGRVERDGSVATEAPDVVATVPKLGDVMVVAGKGTFRWEGSWQQIDGVAPPNDFVPEVEEAKRHEEARWRTLAHELAAVLAHVVDQTDEIDTEDVRAAVNSLSDFKTAGGSLAQHLATAIDGKREDVSDDEPEVGDTMEVRGKVYRWDGSAWSRVEGNT